MVVVLRSFGIIQYISGLSWHSICVLWWTSLDQKVQGQIFVPVCVVMGGDSSCCMLVSH